MWELDYKESWAQKNWCFWTVVLEKTLVSPLDSKEVQPVQLSHPYMTIGKTIDLTRRTFVGKVISLLFNMLSRLVMYGCESWTVKKAERWRIDAFELWCWRRLLRVPWTARRSNQSVLKEISPGCSLEGLMLKLKLQYLATWCEELTHLKRPWCWERLKAGGEGDDREYDD